MKTVNTLKLKSILPSLTFGMIIDSLPRGMLLEILFFDFRNYTL